MFKGFLQRFKGQVSGSPDPKRIARRCFESFIKTKCALLFVFLLYGQSANHIFDATQNDYKTNGSETEFRGTTCFVTFTI